MTPDLPIVRRAYGPWSVLLPAELDRPEILPVLASLPERLAEHPDPVCPPGRHRLDRLALPLSPGAPPADTVVKTYGRLPLWRSLAARRTGSKAERAFFNALRLQRAGVGTPAPLAVAERWDGPRLLESRFVSAWVPNLTDFRAELIRLLSAHPPICADVMALLETVARAVRAFHDAGLLHRDLGNQNIVLRRDATDAPWQVLFLDLNRARPVPDPSPALRGRDLARLDIPSDLRRVFFAMYHGGYPPPREFSRAEARARAAFDRHTALRPFRHPFREARIRHAEHLSPPPNFPRGRDLWIWDDRSEQPIPAYVSRDRRAFLPAANVTLPAAELLRRGLSLRREFSRLRAASFSAPVPMGGAIGLALDPDPATWSAQLDELAGLQGPARIPLLLRLHHHRPRAHWLWTLERAAELHAAGHSVAFALLQSRAALSDPASWRDFLSVAFSAAPFADFFEIGHATNRSKWGVWDFREYAALLAPVREALAANPALRVTGPAAIDFEPLPLAALLRAASPVPFRALSHHLYVDRRGAPENRQGPWDAVDKCAFLRACARVWRFPEDRVVVSEVNWPLAGTGPWSPVTSPYETLGPRRNDPSVTEELYAAFMARYLLLALASGHVSRVYWWRLAAHGFGLVDDSASPRRRRPAYHALRDLLAALAGATYDGSGLQRPAPDAYALSFSRPGAAPFRAEWTLSTQPLFKG